MDEIIKEHGKVSILNEIDGQFPLNRTIFFMHLTHIFCMWSQPSDWRRASNKLKSCAEEIEAASKAKIAQTIENYELSSKSEFTIFFVGSIFTTILYHNSPAFHSIKVSHKIPR